MVSVSEQVVLRISDNSYISGSFSQILLRRPHFLGGGTERIDHAIKLLSKEMSGAKSGVNSYQRAVSSRVAKSMTTQ